MNIILNLFKILMYTDNSILTFGKYKFKKLSQIPFEYLVRIYENKSTNDKELMEYVGNRMKLKEQHKDIIHDEVKICDKFTFITEKVAKDRLKEILSKKDNIVKKPVRTYECEKCGGWHLTAISYEEYEKIISTPQNTK